MGAKLLLSLILLLTMFAVVANGQWWIEDEDDEDDDEPIDLSQLKYLPISYAGWVTNDSGTFYSAGPDEEIDYSHFFNKAAQNKAAQKKEEEEEEEEEEEDDRVLFARIELHHRLNPPHRAGDRPALQLWTTAKTPEYQPEKTIVEKLRDNYRANLLKLMSQAKHVGVPPPTTSAPTTPSTVPTVTEEYYFSPPQPVFYDHKYQEIVSDSELEENDPNIE